MAVLLLLEEPLVTRIGDLLLEGLLVTFFLPLLTWYSIQAASHSRRAGFGRARIFKAGLFRQSVGEFNFEHAIEAYEELIDELIGATFAGGRL